ncbi:hypothetical protein, partial [Pseudomonas peli]|uniref:hypothetical protein n=1 Tax=Pseudomonas peli TaxID=592361 RepID=UPI003D320854
PPRHPHFRLLYGTGPRRHHLPPDHRPELKRRRYTAFQDYNQKRRNTGLYLQDQMALDAWRLTPV